MATAVAGPERLSELVRCPRCRGPVAVGGCAGCGAPCRAEGPVVNFLGDQAFLLPAHNDAAVAAWLLENWQRWDALPPGAGPGQLADGGVTAADLERAAAGSTFQQIRNDVRRVVAGTAAPSPTVEFMLAKSQVGPDSVVLDVGCSAGRHLWELAPRAPRFLAGVDIQLFPLAVGAFAWQARGEPRPPLWCCASALSLPFQDGAFSHVNSFVTLSVVPIRAALAELTRVLAPGGRLTVTLEGMGYWRRDWDALPRFSRGRLNLLRRWAGERLLRCGLNWQGHRLLRRLSGHTQFTRPTIERVVRRAGLAVEECQVLGEYKNRPLLFGLTLRKPGAPPSTRGDSVN
jgi:SAM-dependent methyltransferase